MKWGTLGFVFIGLCLAGCGGQGLFFVEGPHVRMVNAIPSGPRVNGSVGGDPLLSNSTFKDASLYAMFGLNGLGVRFMQSSNGIPLFQQTQTFRDRDYYTVVGLPGTGGNVNPITLLDDHTKPTAGNGALHFVHASPTFNVPLKIFITDSPNPEPTLASATLNSRTDSANLPISAGTIEVVVERASDDAVLFDGLVSLADGQIRTVIVVDNDANSVGTLVLTDRN